LLDPASGKPTRVGRKLDDKGKLNVVTKHEKPSAGKPEGGLKKVEAPIHISNVMLLDPASGKPTRVGRKLDDKGKLKRYSKKTGEIIK
jgi:large subunit ribosomal protein L24